jgi:hypothetical protein
VTEQPYRDDPLRAERRIQRLERENARLRNAAAVLLLAALFLGAAAAWWFGMLSATR